MSIHFDRNRLEQVLTNYELWWEGKLDHPLIRGVIVDTYAPSHEGKVPTISQANCHDFSISPEDIIDAEDAKLSAFEFLGDGYPVMDFAVFGPGILAAMLGSRLDNSTGQVWFHPCESDISKLHVSYDPENMWSRRIKDIYRAGLERWEGKVIMTLPDLGGIMDILASLIGTENLIFALVDEPEEVHRVQKEIQTAWYEAYADFTAALKPQGAYTDWNGLLSREPGYIPQCDFSYMLGPDMFEEFVMNILREDTRRINHTIFHLDGIGAKKHLDALLTLPNLKAIQWVYGVGQPGPHAWLDLYKKVLDAGKQIMIIENAINTGFVDLLPHLGQSPYASFWGEQSRRSECEDILKRCGY